MKKGISNKRSVFRRGGDP